MKIMGHALKGKGYRFLCGEKSKFLNHFHFGVCDTWLHFYLNCIKINLI